MSRQISRREFLKGLLFTTGSVALGGCAGDIVRVTLLHVNDFHGALRARSEGSGERGGAANLIGTIERERAAAPGPVLLLNVGDAFQGTYISNSNRGQAVVELMNLARTDALALGNHEFDWGLDVLRARIGQTAFPCLAANLETDDGRPLDGVQPYAIVDVGQLTVGLLGLTYHELRTVVKASAIEGIRSLPPTETVRRYLSELQEQADLIVVLSHLGIDGDRALARSVPELPVIVGAHSHDALHSGEKVGETWIAQAGAYGESLGRIEIAFDRRRAVPREVTARLIAVTGDAHSAEAEAIIDRWGKEADKTGSQVVGEAAIPLRQRPGQEMGLGNLIADAMRAADAGDGRRFDLAVHNDGGIRAGLDAGPITYAEIYAVLPFDNTLVGLDMTGAQVRRLFESGIDNDGTRIQISGGRFTYSMARPSGQRIAAAAVGGETLDPERVYRVATIDYMHTHSRYERSLGRGTNATYGELCLDAVVEYIRANSPVRAEVEGRMRRV